VSQQDGACLDEFLEVDCGRDEEERDDADGEEDE
jgi:hypothetical protein